MASLKVEEGRARGFRDPGGRLVERQGRLLRGEIGRASCRERV